MHKIKRIIPLFKNLLKRDIHNFHHGKSLPITIVSAARFITRFGPIKTIGVIKKELLGDNRIIFPNGILFGTDYGIINRWYKKHAKKVVIVIPSYNDSKLIENCLNSIKITCSPDLYHVVIVDDYCQESSKTELSKFRCENIDIIFRKENGGFSKAVNTGLNYSLKRFPKLDIVLLNSDTIAHENWLSSLQHGAYQHSKNVGIVGAKLLYEDGRIQSAGSFRNTEFPEWFDHYFRFQDKDYGPANVSQYCIGVTGACMYITNKTLREIGILDEKFPFAFEDMDFCLRAWQRNIKVLYYPAAELTHLESATRSLNKNISKKERQSVVYFWKKWGSWFDERNIRNSDGKIKIIYVLQSTGVSGGHRIVFEHLNNLKKLGYDAELWALDSAPKWMKLDTPTKTFKNYTALVNQLKNVEAIKVATWWETASPVWEASINKGVPAFIIHEIESAFYPNQPEIQSSVISCYRKEFNNIVSCGFTLEDINSLGLKGTLIPCGYDSEVYKVNNDVKKEESQLLAIGRSFFQKNFKQTLNAWSSLKPKPKLVVFGSEPDLVAKHKEIEYLFMPSNEKVNYLYNQSTAFIQTSYHEGFCLPVLEAMASGCPVICTDAKGNKDFSINNKNCLMVEKDDVQGTAKAIEKIMKDSKLRAKLRKGGLETAKKYTWKSVINSVNLFYSSLDHPADRIKYMNDTIRKFEK